MIEATAEDTLMGTVNQTLSSNEVSQLLTIKQFCTAFPWPSESAMRSYIYRAEVLGLSEAFVRVGRRVLIIPQKFFSAIQNVESRSTKGETYEIASRRKGKTYA
jgi:hypothetical protein